MTPALPRRGRIGALSFAVLEHDPAVPVREQRDQVGTVIPELLGLPPGRVSLRREPGGRPLLEAGEPVGCSIAHCRWLSLVGVARGRGLGVDLEAVRPGLPLGDVAAAFFAPAEVRWLRALPLPRRPLATTLLWSAKEAFLKATGKGIVAGLCTPPLDGLDLLPLLDGANELACELPGAAEIHLRHGQLGADHLVMAAVLADPDGLQG